MPLGAVRPFVMISTHKIIVIAAIIHNNYITTMLLLLVQLQHALISLWIAMATSSAAAHRVATLAAHLSASPSGSSGGGGGGGGGSGASDGASSKASGGGSSSSASSAAATPGAAHGGLRQDTTGISRGGHHSLAGYRVLITGASRGIGQAIGEAVAARGAAVALLAKTEVPDPRLPGTIHTAAAAIAAAAVAGGVVSSPAAARVLAVPCDIRSEAAVAAAVATRRPLRSRPPTPRR